MLARGLPRTRRIGADNRAKERREVQEFENLSRKRCRLVRAHGHRHAVSRQCGKRRFHIGEHTRLGTANLVVAGLERISGRWWYVAVERAFQQPLEAFADEFANGSCGQIAEAVLAARKIDRVGERGV